MSGQPDFTVSAQLKSWLFSAIAEWMPKAIAAYHEQAKPVSKPHVALNISDYDESHNDSDHDGVLRKRPWKGNSAPASKGKAPAKNPRLSYSSMSHPILDPLEASTSHHNLQVVNEYCAGPILQTAAPETSRERDLKQTTGRMPSSYDTR
ncbi:Hypothetical predicted protein [Pelobates cultripes]|uniref:Uncharacterized protein n=1 Tax=Pelobates cultripes TaxID=61616 RepID=A0AAD1VQU5_PELCU|nr:Hypothetical predicted protein [Pelobates cultripes]